MVNKKDVNVIVSRIESDNIVLNYVQQEKPYDELFGLQVRITKIKDNFFQKFNWDEMVRVLDIVNELQYEYKLGLCNYVEGHYDRRQRWKYMSKKRRKTHTDEVIFNPNKIHLVFDPFIQGFGKLGHEVKDVSGITEGYINGLETGIQSIVFYLKPID